MEQKTEKLDIKKFVNTSYVLIAIIVILYLLDCYLPLPEGYTGYSPWNDDVSPAVNYIMGNCGGLVTNYLGLGVCLENGTALYRHFTQMFLHGGLLHLIANIIGLVFIGRYCEKRFGWWVTAILFLSVGFTESFITDPLYLAMAPHKAEQLATEVSLGASGGIYGLMGASLAAIFFNVKSFKKIGKPTIIVSAIYGILTTYVVSFGWTTVCHNVALLLGLAFGTALILPFYLIKKKKANPDISENQNKPSD